HALAYPSYLGFFPIRLDVLLAVQNDLVLVQGVGQKTFRAPSGPKNAQPLSLTLLKGALDRLAKPSADPPSLVRMEVDPFSLFIGAWVQLANDSESTTTRQVLARHMSGTPLTEETAKKIGKGVLFEYSKRLKKDLDKLRVRLVVKAGEALRLQVDCPTPV